MARWPGMWKAFEHAVKRWFEKKRAKGLHVEMRHETADAYWQAYLDGFE